MISCLISFLIAALVLFLVLWVVKLVIGMFGVPIPSQVIQIIGIICVLILLLEFLPCLTGGALGPWPWHAGSYR